MRVLRHVQAELQNQPELRLQCRASQTSRVKRDQGMNAFMQHGLPTCASLHVVSVCSQMCCLCGAAKPHAGVQPACTWLA